MSILKLITRNLNQLTGSAVVRGVANQKLLEVGEVTKLEIDPTAKSISAEIQLKGQPAAIAIKILDYELSDDSEGGLLSWSSIQVAAGQCRIPADIKEKLEYIL